MSKQRAAFPALGSLVLGLSSLLLGCSKEPIVVQPETSEESQEFASTVRLSPELTAPLYDEPPHLARALSNEVAEVGSVRAKQQDLKSGAPPHQQVPAFVVQDSSGSTWNSQTVLGNSAVAVVFFASWCELCARKMPVIRRALEKAGGVRTLWVAVDGEATQADISGFMTEQRLSAEPYVLGVEHPKFVSGYNPISSIPLVVVVGKSGRLVDYQVGWQYDDGPRLEAALVRARDH